MNNEIRRAIVENGISIWLRAELDVLVERTGRRGGRPLLENGDSKEILQGLMDERYPVYAEADIVIDSQDVPIDATVNETADALTNFIANENNDE